MTGKRLLDAAAIIKASRGVASKHLALRKHQLDFYSKTSSIAKAVKSQTDRVTLTVKAASALTERFNEQGPGSSTLGFSRDTPTKDEPVPSQNSVEGANGGVIVKQGEPQDQFYTRSQDNTTAEPPPNSALNVKQEKAKGHPLPDGFISPQWTNKSTITHDEEVCSELQQEDSVKEPLRDPQGREQGLRPTSSNRTSIPEPAGSRTTPSADQPKASQPEAEKQIPSLAAEPPPAKASELEARQGPESEDPAISVSQEQDIFYTPPTSSGRVLSALPRFKLPRVTEDAQESDEHVPDAHINQDVYYSSTPKDQEQSVAGSQAVPEQEQLPEEAYSEIFHSPRIAKMMRGQPGQDSTSKGVQLPSAKSWPVKQGKTLEENEQVTTSMRTPTQDESQAFNSQSDTPTSLTSEQEGERDVQILAADIAKDTEDKTFNTTEVSI